MKLTLTIVLTGFILMTGVTAQAQRWTKTTISEAGFSVSAPGELTRVPEFTGEDGLVMEPSRPYRFETFYAMAEERDGSDRFGVAVVEGELRTRLIESGTMDDYLNYLGRIFLGDPTETLYFRQSTPVAKNGLKGLDHVFIRPQFGGKPMRYAHGRIFDNGRKSYVVIYRAEFEEDLQSDEALKFLNSFRLTTTPRRHRHSRVSPSEH